MRNQWSWRTKSRLKAVDNTVKISQVIGKKDSNGQPFYPSFTNTTVVLVSEDKRTYETTKATADGLGNLTFLKRGLADDGTDTEVAKFKRAWMPGTLMYITFASEDYDNKPDFSDIPTCLSQLSNDTGFIDNTVNDLCYYTQTCDLGAVALSNDFNDLYNQPQSCDYDINDLGDLCCCRDYWNCAVQPGDLGCYMQCCDLGSANLILQRNGTDVDCFNANATVDKCINITVPTQACDVCALPDSTKYGASVDLTIDSSTFVVTSQLKDQDGCSLGSACTIDLPLESVVVDGCYNSCTKEIELTLQNCCQICFSVADLVNGLQSEITCSNKLSSDLVDDSGHTNLFVDCTEKCCISSALQPNDNVSCLCNDAGYLVSTDLSCYVQCCDVNLFEQTACRVCDLTGADNCHYPTAKAVADAIQGAGGGDMMASTYDPNNVAGDAFDYCNFSNTPDLSCYQEKLTAGNNITINANTISGDFNYATSSTAAACATKCVCIPEITQLCVGQQITVKPSETASNCATSLKLNDFTSYPIRFNNAALTSTTDGYVRGANCLTTFLFDGSYWQVVSKSYDINTTYSLNVLYDAGKYTAGTGTYALSRYSLVMEKDDGTWEKITNTSAAYSTATSKTVNTNGFKLNHIRYYSTTTNVANGALIATNTLSNQAASVDLRYSTNCGGTTTWAEGDYIYLVGTIGVDGLFYLDTTTWWTNQLPVTNDGKLYIRIGLCLAANGYTTSFLVDRPIFYYDNGIKVYGQADNKQDKISDLDTIRTGAACGASALQNSDIACINGCCLTCGGDICLSGLPDQTGCCGKYLMTDGCCASWETVTGGIDNDTTCTSTVVAHIRAGTEAEYNCIATKDSCTIYHIY